MTHPLDEIAVEAAAKALYAQACEQRGFDNDIDEVWEISEFRENCMAGLNAALSAAFKSASERGMARDGDASIQDGDVWSVYSGWKSDYAEAHREFPVTIIRHKGVK